MGRESSITYEQVAAIADVMKAAGANPTSRAVRERLGNTGSMGTINKMLQTWKQGQERAIANALSLPAPVQRTILDFLAQELATAKSTLETALAEEQQEAADLATENERQAADLDAASVKLLAVQTELATLQGRVLQVEADLQTAQTAAERERNAAEAARTELAKAQLRLEAMPRLEKDLVDVRAVLDEERAGRVASEQRAAVLAAQLDASDKRAVEIESRETAALARLAELERQSAVIAANLNTANLQGQACQARLESAARELDNARELTKESRLKERTALEETAELRGLLLAERAALAEVRKQLDAAKAGNTKT